MTSKGGGYCIAALQRLAGLIVQLMENWGVSAVPDREGSGVRRECHQQPDGADDRQWQDTFPHGKGLQEPRRSAGCNAGMCCSLRLEPAIL